MKNPTCADCGAVEPSGQNRAVVPQSAGVSLRCVQKKPSGHVLQLCAPVSFWKVPALHESHSTELAFACADPAWQASRSWRPGQRKPGAQSVHTKLVSSLLYVPG